MKEKKIINNKIDDDYFASKDQLYNPDDKSWFDNQGIKSRFEWYLYRLHKKKGATYKSFVEVDKHVRKGKGNGGTTDMLGHNPDIIRDNTPYEPLPLELNDIFDFNYRDMINTKPNDKFNKVLDLVFNHEYNDYSKNQEQENYIEIYNKLKENGDIYKVNYIYQRFSGYIKKNHLSRKFVDGSIICNVAIMTSEYLRTGQIEYDYDFLNNIVDYNNNDDFRFHLWLILQCFTSNNKWRRKYVDGYFIINWWAVCKLQHRYSDKDMKTKGQCSGFKDGNGKYIYKKY